MSTRRTNGNDSLQLPGRAQILAELGHMTARAVAEMHKAWTSNSLLFSENASPYPILAEAMTAGWHDEQAAAVIDAVRECYERGREVDVHALKRWLRVHQNDAQAVIDCLRLEPPDDISIIQLLSRAGSQKLVFLANWEIAQREIVLKSFIGDAKRLIHRELQPHPLSMEHPNIIETHFHKNDSGEIFLIERRLPMVLSDEWNAHGIQEAANLFRDIANALAFLQEKQLVHGDVKPDNIGFEDGNYILLDFGICRPIEKFAEDPTPTGSLRTRAPEVLVNEKSHSPASDIWGLGATVYNALVGRFPLFDKLEAPPRLSHTSQRSAFEDTLRNRVNNEWTTRVDLSLVPEPLHDPLAKALDRDPSKRIVANQLVKLVEKELAAFVRIAHGSSRFSPGQELEQLTKYLPKREVLALMPHSQKHDLRRRLDGLKGAKGLTPSQKQQIDALMNMVA